MFGLFQNTRRTVASIRKQSHRLQAASDAELRNMSLALKYEVLSNKNLQLGIASGFPMVIEAIRRTHQLVPHDVQIQAAIEMAQGRIVEMKTGEGKTITATMPAYVN